LEFASTAPSVVPSDKLWWARFHGYMKNRSDDGTLMQVSPQREWAEEYDANSYPFERACSFGVPLIDITSAALLQERVLKPLLASVRGPHALLHA